jgi:hypothetical protein
VPQTTNPSRWTREQMLIWVRRQVEIPPQEAEQYCNELKPETIEGALNALARALFNAIYGAEGLPVVAAYVPSGHGYKDVATLFPPPPSLAPGVLDALREEIRQFIRQQPDVRYNPVWGRWTWPVCVSAAQGAPTPTQPTESAVAELGTAPTDPPSPVPVPVTSVSPPAVPPTEGSKIAPSPTKPPPTALERANEEVAPGPSHTAASVRLPANLPKVGFDPAIADAITHALKPVRPTRAANVPVITESVESLSNSPVRSGEAKALGSDPAARAEELMPDPVLAVKSNAASPKPKQFAPTKKKMKKKTTKNRSRRRGPKPGTVKRYVSADRAQFDAIERLMRDEQLSLTAATKKLAESRRVAGTGTSTSRAQRLAKLYTAERLRVRKPHRQ